jgi:hypothetical protein
MQEPQDFTNQIKTMLSAMLERTIQDYFTSSPSERRDAKKWIFDSPVDLIFNYPYVCDILGICQQTLKKKVLSYEKKAFKFKRGNRSSDFQTMDWFNNNCGDGYEPMLHKPKLDR